MENKIIYPKIKISFNGAKKRKSLLKPKRKILGFLKLFKDKFKKMKIKEKFRKIRKIFKEIKRGTKRITKKIKSTRKKIKKLIKSKRKNLLVFLKNIFSKERLKIPFLLFGFFLIFLIVFSCFYFTARMKEILDFSSLFSPRTQLTLKKNEEIDPAIREFGLKIDKLGILAPVILNVDGSDKKIYLEELKRGVAHFENTALPGEGSNVFIFGHSSTAVGIGPYSKIFARLGELEKEDKIIVFYKDEKYTYSVFEKIVVEKTELSVLEPTEEEQLTLMTCWPIGTSEKRLIIKASLIE